MPGVELDTNLNRQRGAPYRELHDRRPQPIIHDLLTTLVAERTPRFGGSCETSGSEARGLGHAPRAAGRSPGRQSGYHDWEGARPGNRARRSQQRRMEAGAVSELLGIARFKFHEGKVE